MECGIKYAISQRGNCKCLLNCTQVQQRHTYLTFRLRVLLQSLPNKAWNYHTLYIFFSHVICITCSILQSIISKLSASFTEKVHSSTKINVKVRKKTVNILNTKIKLFKVTNRYIAMPNDIILVSLLQTLNIFCIILCILFQYFH